MGPRSRIIVAGLAAAALAVGSPAQSDVASWPNTIPARLEALALVQTLNAAILASPSATVVLEKWCDEHRLAGAGVAKIVARLIRSDFKPTTEDQRQRLQVGSDAELAYRRVQLVCGERVLSEADNWYVPSRLTPAMNQLLATTDIPFGKVVQNLTPYRRTLAATLAWWPLPPGWEIEGFPPIDQAAALTMPDVLFEHRALLFTGEQPISEVHEHYQRALLDFLPPRP